MKRGTACKHTTISWRVHCLNVIRVRKWDVLTPRQRFRVLANIGGAYFEAGDPLQAGQYFIDAAVHQPDAADAVAKLAVGYELIGDRDKARSIATTNSERFPDSCELTALLIRTAPRTATALALEAQLDSRCLQHAEVQIALALRAESEHDLECGLRCARRAVKIAPEWIFARMLLAQILINNALGTDDPRKHPERRVTDPSALQEATVLLSTVIDEKHVADQQRGDALLLRAIAYMFADKRA